MCFKFIDFEIQNLEFVNDLECPYSSNQSCSIYMFVVDKFFSASNICFKFTYFDIQNFEFLKQSPMKTHPTPKL